MKSMTGFGRGTYAGDDLEIAVEIKTVNNRFLDVQLRLGNELQAFEAPLKRLITSRLSRGRVEVNIQYERDADLIYEVNRPLISGYLQAFREIQAEFQLSGEPDINVIARLPNAITAKKAEAGNELFEGVEKAASEALSDLETMRTSEGAMLKNELNDRLHNIQTSSEQIRSEAASIPEEFRQRLTKRIEEFLAKSESQIELDQGRLAQEVAYLSDRADISEEITRLQAHIEHFRSIMGEEKEVGKRLDFLTQELNREANTIASKSSNMTVKEHALQIKSEIEKIREQVQNVE